MPKHRDFLERLSSEDPNYEVGRQFYLKAWADSHGLAADVLAGRVSLSEFVDGCIHTFDQGAEAHLAIKDETTIPARCRALDDFEKKFIRKFMNSLTPQTKRLGKANVTSAINKLSRRVREITARSKQRILEAAIPPQSQKRSVATDRKQAMRRKVRSVWLDEKRSSKEWTSDVEIGQNGGPTYNTTQRYRSGRKSTRDGYVRGLLAKAFGCKLSEVPG